MNEQTESVVLLFGILLVPAILVMVWLSDAKKNLTAAPQAAADVAIASAAEDDYCSPKLKGILRRVAGACGLLKGSGRGCKPGDAKSVAAMSGRDFNALFKPLSHRARIIQFDHDVTELDMGGKTLVESSWSDQRGASFFFVVARASAVGDPIYNQTLSQKRAEAVLTHLEQKFDNPDLKGEVGLLLVGRGVRPAFQGVLRMEAKRRRRVQYDDHQPERLRRMDRLHHLTELIAPTSSAAPAFSRRDRPSWALAAGHPVLPKSLLREGRPSRTASASNRRSNLVLALAFFVLAGCEDDGAKKKEVAPSRFAAVKSTKKKTAAASFCEKTFPKNGGTARRWTPPPERALPAQPRSVAKSAKGGSIWVNLWASWCVPCIKEIPLLEEWRATLDKERIPVRFEMWTVDEEGEDLKPALNRHFPGKVRWLKGAENLPGFLEHLGVDENSAVPIHALVDDKGMLRCVRVGQVGEAAYGSVRTILTGS